MALHKPVTGDEKVEGYVRTNENGQTVTVKPHDRSHSEAAQAAIAMPGRPPIAATPGRFANERSIPNFWPEPKEVVTETPPPDTSPEAADAADALAEMLNAKGGSAEAVTALRALRGATPKAKAQVKKDGKAAKVRLAVARATGDPDLIALAMNPVRVSRYKRRSNVTGKVTAVRSYTQLRDLVSALGGPQLAAKKGITADLFTKVLPEAAEIFKDTPDEPEDRNAPEPEINTPAPPEAIESLEAPDDGPVAPPEVAKALDAADAPEAPEAPEPEAPAAEKKTGQPRVGATDNPKQQRLARASARRKATPGREQVAAEKAEVNALKAGDREAWGSRSEAFAKIRDSGGIAETRSALNGFVMHREQPDDDGAFTIYVTDRVHPDEVVAESFFSDVNGRGWEEQADVHPEHRGQQLLSEARAWAEDLTEAQIVTDAPSSPPSRTLDTSKPPMVGKRQPLVSTEGFTEWNGAKGPRLAPGDKVYASRSQGTYRSYLFVGEDGKAKKYGFLHTGYRGAVEVGDEGDVANFITDSQREYEIDNDLPEADFEEQSNRLFPSGEFSLDAALNDHFDLAFTFTKQSGSERRTALREALAAVPDGTRLQDENGMIYTKTGDDWEVDGARLQAVALAYRFSVNGWGTAEEVIAAATMDETLPPLPTQFGHDLAYTPKPGSFTRGFPEVTGDGSGPLAERAREAALNAMSWVPEPLAKRFPAIFVNHESTRRLLGPEEAGTATAAFVAMYPTTGRQEMHLAPHMTDDPELFEMIEAANTDSGNHAPGATDSWQRTIDHESGHVWENLLIYHGSQPAQDEFYNDLLDILADEYGYRRPAFDSTSTPRERWDAAVSRYSPELRKDISRYGGQDPREILAEAWSEYIGSDNPRPLSSRIGRAMQEMTLNLAEEFEPGSTRKDKGTTKPRPDLPEEPEQPDYETVAEPLTRDMFSSPDTPRTRGVSPRDFQQIAARGKERLAEMARGASEPTGLDENWEQIKADAYAATREEWGGITVDTHTGVAISGNEERYALTVKRAGEASTWVDPESSQDDFNAAMEAARSRFEKFWQAENAHLGVFYDVDSGRIDIDPVLVVDNRDDQESIGAYTHNIGGAYGFHDGNGYWPPYVDEGAEDGAGLQGPGAVADSGDEEAPGGGREGPDGGGVPDGPAPGAEAPDEEAGAEEVEVPALNKMEGDAPNYREDGELTGHRPDETAPAVNDLTTETDADEAWAYPADVYTHPDRYGGRDVFARESAKVIKDLQGQPGDTPVTIYRALPKGQTKMNKGDWIAISRAYAEQHLASNGSDDWDIIETQVPASTVLNGGNDIIEWGYWGPSIDTAKVETTPVINKAVTVKVPTKRNVLGMLKKDMPLEVWQDGVWKRGRLWGSSTDNRYQYLLVKTDDQAEGDEPVKVQVEMTMGGIGSPLIRKPPPPKMAKYPNPVSGDQVRYKVGGRWREGIVMNVIFTGPFSDRRMEVRLDDNENGSTHTITMAKDGTTKELQLVRAYGDPGFPAPAPSDDLLPPDLDGKPLVAGDGTIVLDTNPGEQRAIVKLADGDVVRKMRGSQRLPRFLITSKTGRPKAFIDPLTSGEDRIVTTKARMMDQIASWYGQQKFIQNATKGDSRGTGLDYEWLQGPKTVPISPEAIAALSDPVFTFQPRSDNRYDNGAEFEKALADLPMGYRLREPNTGQVWTKSPQPDEDDAYDHQWTTPNRAPASPMMMGMRLGNSAPAFNGDPLDYVKTLKTERSPMPQVKRYKTTAAPVVRAGGADFKNAPIASAAVAEAFTFVPPEIAEVAKDYNWSIKAAPKDDMKTWAYVQGGLRDTPQQIVFHSHMWDPATPILFEAARQQGWHPQTEDGKDIQFTVNHETGHVWNNMLTAYGSVQTRELFWQRMSDALAEHSGYYRGDLPEGVRPGSLAEIRYIVERHRADMKEWLSTYAGTNQQEFLAEAWAEFTTNQKPRPLAMAVGTAVQEMLERLVEDMKPDKDAADRLMKAMMKEPTE